VKSTERKKLLANTELTSSSVRIKRTHWETSGDIDQETVDGGGGVRHNGGDGYGGTGTGSQNIYGLIGRRVQYENSYRMSPEIKFNFGPMEMVRLAVLV